MKKTFVDSPANISEDFDIIELSDSCNAHDQTEKTQTKKSLKMGKSPQKNLTSEGSNFISTSNASNIDYLLSLLPPTELSVVPLEDPIIIRGNGNMTLFGLSNSFSSTFPSSLLGRVSREEFEYTMNRINHLLRQQHSTNAKFLLLGCLCCCCSLGCSLLWPTFALSKRTRSSLQKLLAMENSRLYNKLGLNWRVTKQQSHTNHSFMEYILVIDFLPKMQIYQPD
ncbi:hypothetical protein RDWZM_006440 [Blomia tropicalis]|uniref:Golgin subfamily A member 7/ERF4 domain-containing protein n=1 Tax=Blomia tropicalis TaxID=40697 RepID=A0A9Q0RLS0_BLOTA|nr:hypothetical protein RDWZM_006440 [Blomia tropicalis]